MRWLGYGRLLRVAAHSTPFSTLTSASTSVPVEEEEDEVRLFPFLFLAPLVSFSHPDTKPLLRKNLLSVEGLGLRNFCEILFYGKEDRLRTEHKMYI